MLIQNGEMGNRSFKDGLNGHRQIPHDHVGFAGSANGGPSRGAEAERALGGEPVPLGAGPQSVGEARPNGESEAPRRPVRSQFVRVANLRRGSPERLPRHRIEAMKKVASRAASRSGGQERASQTTSALTVWNLRRRKGVRPRFGEIRRGGRGNAVFGETGSDPFSG